MIQNLKPGDSEEAWEEKGMCQKEKKNPINTFNTAAHTLGTS